MTHTFFRCEKEEGIDTPKDSTEEGDDTFFFYFTSDKCPYKRRTSFRLCDGFNGLWKAIAKKINFDSKNFMKIESRDRNGEWILVADQEDVIYVSELKERELKITTISQQEMRPPQPVKVIPIPQAQPLQGIETNAPSHVIQQKRSRTVYEEVTAVSAPPEDRMYVVETINASQNTGEDDFPPLDLSFSGETISTLSIVWVYPNKSLRGMSRTKWRANTGKRKKITKEDFRRQRQSIYATSPSKMVKRRPRPFPRVVNIPDDINIVKIHIKEYGEDRSRDLLVGNEVLVDDNEADFYEFSFQQASFNEQSKQYETRTLVFTGVDRNGRSVFTLESAPIVVVSNVSQLGGSYNLEKITPDCIKIGGKHDIELLGKFKNDSAIRVYIGSKSVDFDFKSDTRITITGFSIEKAGVFPVYIKVKNLETERINLKVIDNTEASPTTTSAFETFDSSFVQTTPVLFGTPSMDTQWMET